MLRPPVESTQFTSIRYGERLTELGATPSIDSVGDSFDCEDPVAEMRYFSVTLSRVAWFNRTRLHGALGDTPPTEHEEAHYAQLTTR